MDIITILQIITICIGVFSTIITILISIKLEYGKNIVEVDVAERQNRRLELKQIVRKLITYADPDNIEISYLNKNETIYNITYEVSSLKTIFQLIYAEDVEIIVHASDIKKTVCLIFANIDNEGKVDENLREILRNQIEEFVLCCNKYNYIDWKRVQSELNGKASKTSDWKKIKDTQNEKYLVSMIRNNERKHIKFCDYHIHTNFSDGEFSPQQVFELLRTRNLSEFAIADHDTVDGVNNLIDNFDKRLINKHNKSFKFSNGMILRTGVELTVNYNYEGDIKTLHLLGYNIDTKNYELLEKLKQRNFYYNEGVKKIIKSINDMNFNISLEDITPAYGKLILLSDIINYLINNFKISQAELEQIFSLEHYLTDNNYSIQEAIDIIHNANGIAVLAHPFIYYVNNSPKEFTCEVIKDIIIKLKSIGLDGVEALYANFNNYQQEFLAMIAKEQNLKISIGSDFHNKINRFETINEFNNIYYNAKHSYDIPIDVMK